MYKNEILTNVLKSRLKGRLDTIENNYSHHTEKMMQSFKILDEMKQVASKMDSKLNQIILDNSRPSLTRSVSRREINKSFTSTSNTTSKTLIANKSKIFDNKKIDKSKTPIKRQADRSIGKSIQRQKSGLFNSNNDMNNNQMNKKTTLSKNLTMNKFNTLLTKEDENTLKRGISKTPRNKPALSPIDRKINIISKVNTPINRSPDISRNKTAQLISKKGADKTNLSNISKTSKHEAPSTKTAYQQYKTCSNSNVNMNNITTPVLSKNNVNIVTANLSNVSSSNTNLKTNPNVANTNDSFKFKISQNGNISQIIDIDNSMPDESMINNKDDLFITSTINDNDINLNNSIINNLMSSINFNSPKYKGIKLEYDEVLDDRWSMFEQYLNKLDKIKLLLVNKKYAKYSMMSLIEMIRKIKDSVDEKIKRFKVFDISSANGMNQTATYSFIDAFPLSKGSNKAIPLLNDNLYVKLFTESTTPKPDILFVYKLYFQLIQHPLVELFDDKNLFWKESCKYFLTDSEGNIGTLIAMKLREINISPENIYRLYNLIGDDVIKINPNNFSKVCGTTGLFVFFIKDAIEHIGLGSKCDKNMNIEKCIWILSNLSQLIDKKIKNMQKIMDQYYNIY